MKPKYVYIILRKYKDNVASIESKDASGSSWGEAMAFSTPKVAQAYLDNTYKPNEPDSWLFQFAIVPVPATFIAKSNICITKEA